MPVLSGGANITVESQIAAGLITNASINSSAAIALTKLAAGAEVTANKGAVSGYAPLDASQLVPLANLPTYMIKMFSASGTTTATTITTVSSKAFSANDFSSGDVLVIKAWGTTTDTEVTLDYLVDGIQLYKAVGDGAHFDEISLVQHPTTNTSALSAGTSTYYGTTNTSAPYVFTLTGLSANWITTAFTLSLRAKSTAAGTCSYAWIVYKLKA